MLYNKTKPNTSNSLQNSSPKKPGFINAVALSLPDKQFPCPKTFLTGLIKSPFKQDFFPDNKLLPMQEIHAYFLLILP